MRSRLIPLVFLALSCAAAHAQITISQPLADQLIGGVGNMGQSFTPGDADSGASSNYYLTQFTFVVGSAATTPGHSTPTYLGIFTATLGGHNSDSTFTSIGYSTNTQVFTSAGATDTWTFDNLALDKTTVYYALFTSAQTPLSNQAGTAGSFINQPFAFKGSNVYSGGALIDNWEAAASAGLDARFSATFVTAIPEPATTALLGGLGALAVGALIRRSSPRLVLTAASISFTAARSSQFPLRAR